MPISAAICGLALARVLARTSSDAYVFTDHYRKVEYDIPMRDRVTLHTILYLPTDVPGKHPILMERTPYSAGPYGSDMKGGMPGSRQFCLKGYIFGFQDVRGRYLSQGNWENIRPEIGASLDDSGNRSKIDESTDTYDTVDWLVKHVPGNNGSVGLWGISYPGFYAAVGAINSHPALKAVSPQAPCSDWFVGDDVHHNGAFFLQDNFDFSAWFDVPRKGLEKIHNGINVDHGGKSAYEFYLSHPTAGDLEQAFFHGQVPYWNEIMSHPNDDAYWQARSVPSQMTGVKCAVLTVGGWFDAEDMWGAINVGAAVTQLDPAAPSFRVMGPWSHGMWAGGPGSKLGDIDFGQATGEKFREQIEFPFFEKYLRDQDVPAPAKMTAFETGTNKWRMFDVWPPSGLVSKSFYLSDQHSLSETSPTGSGQDSYLNDPAHPTPYLADYAHNVSRTTTYMVDDQRWAEARADVATYRGAALDRDLTVAGPVDVDLWITTTGTDADLVVKVIDVWPDDGSKMAGYEQNLRADIMRARFRDSLEKPSPIVPGQPTRVHFKMNDVLHTFRAGHRIMVQVQSSWFPLVDRNPNAYVDPYFAKPTDFQSATISILHDPAHPSHVSFGAL